MTFDQLNEIINRGLVIYAILLIVFVIAFHFYGKKMKKG